MSIRKAALAAGYQPSGNNNPYNQGRELFDHPKVQQAIRERLEREHITANEILTRLAQQARADVGSFLDASGILNLTETSPTHLIKSLTQTVKENGDVTTRVELYSSQEALVQLAKIMGLYTTKLAITVTHEYEQLSDLERAGRILKLLETARARKETDVIIDQ